MNKKINYYILETREGFYTIIRENLYRKTLIGFLCSLLEGKYYYYVLCGKEPSTATFYYQDTYNSIEEFAKQYKGSFSLFSSYEEANYFLKEHLKSVKEAIDKEKEELYNQEIIGITEIKNKDGING